MRWKKRWEQHCGHSGGHGGHGLSKLETQLGSLCLWISLSLISTSTLLCLRCWKRRSTNLWPSGAAPWNPDCRTGFLFLLIKLGNQEAPSLTIFWSELLLIRGSIAANDTLKTKAWKTQTISFFAFLWRIEQRCTMSLLIFQIVKSVCRFNVFNRNFYIPSCSQRSKKFLNGVNRINSLRKTFMSNHSANAPKVQ